MRQLTLGFSPCPNDTFIFHALVHGIVSVPGYTVQPHLADIETLNRRAFRGDWDVVKVSYGALPHLLDRYALLRSGGALGRGCGPLVVSRRNDIGRRLTSDLRIAIPGRHTTANLLLRLFAPEATNLCEMDYASILTAVAAGEVDAGLIIHESRFTYPAYGLRPVVDLGEWWESVTGSPIPLGAIVARRDLAEEIQRIQLAIRRSVEYAVGHPGASAEYVAANAREMSTSVVKRHISLYVNDFSVDLGMEGEAAVRTLIARAAVAGFVPGGERDLFGGSATT